jgi:hypothetical protein
MKSLGTASTGHRSTGGAPNRRMTRKVAGGSILPGRALAGRLTASSALVWYGARCSGTGAATTCAYCGAMKLPGAPFVIVDEAKVRDYLLALRHPTGGSKAVAFHALGYRQNNWRRLRDDLVRLAREIDVDGGRSNAFGDLFVGVGALVSPSGRTFTIKSVWILRYGEARSRFVTAYPWRVV